MSAKRGSVLIAGCGYVGLALSRHLREQGFTVWGLRRSWNAAEKIKQAGAIPFIADLTQPVTLGAMPEAQYVISTQAPGRTEADHRSTYLEGTRNLIEALVPNPPKKFLCVSSTGVYGDHKGEWVDEETEPRPDTENGKVLLEREVLALNAPFPSLVLRLGGIYGPHRDRLKLLRDGTVVLSDPGYINHIHIEDAVRLIHFLIERRRSKQVYLGVDDAPVLRSELYQWLVDESGVQVPIEKRSIPGVRATASKRCSNRKIKALGFVLKYPTYREGFAQIVIDDPVTFPKHALRRSQEKI